MQYQRNKASVMMRLDHELTDSIQQKICEALRIGASYELAARYAGIQLK